jgi:hypothetical protein
MTKETTMTAPTPPLALRPFVLALAAALPLAAAAAPASTSAYRTDAQNTHVEDATSKGVDQVNMITCFMSAIRPDALVNQGAYNALVDKKKCDPESRSSSDNASADGSAASNAPSYMSAVVNSARASNSDPMRAKIWIDEQEKDFAATIFVNLSATEAPSTTNPYGVFRLDYCGKGDSGPCMMRGYLDGSAEGINYFETEGIAPNANTKALRLTTSGTDSGAGLLHMSEQGQTVDFSFAYNASYFRRSDANGDTCFSRDASDPDTGMSVWRYGLYDASTGARVDRLSGFPIDYTSGDGTLVHGHMGYWGLWMPQGVDVPNGATVQRVEYSEGHEPTRTDYTLAKSAGRLMKYTKQTRTLASLDKMHFQVWVGDATTLYSGAPSNTQYEMYWDDHAGSFKLTGVVDCSNGPCQTNSFDVEKTVAAGFFSTMGGANGWSPSLGGQLFIPLAGVADPVPSGSINVIYRTQDLVYPSDMPSTLYCVRDCLTASAINAYFSNSAESPFAPGTSNNWQPVGANSVVGYTADASSALLKDGTGSGITFTNADALQQHPQYQWGLRTGRLVSSMSAAQCPNDAAHYCDWAIDQADVYYQWETGPNQWNQFAALRDGAGQIVAFQAPLSVNYTVPSGAAYGAYAGKTIVLQYGGFGELWGIPGHCVSRFTNAAVGCDTPDSRYVPAFVIPFDETAGRVDANGTTMLVKWLDREIRFAKKDLSVCTGAGITLPSGLALPGEAGLQDTTDPASSVYIGAKPVLTDPPRVIQGEVKY